MMLDAQTSRYEGEKYEKQTNLKFAKELITMKNHQIVDGRLLQTNKKFLH